MFSVGASSLGADSPRPAVWRRTRVLFAAGLPIVLFVVVLVRWEFYLQNFFGFLQLACLTILSSDFEIASTHFKPLTGCLVLVNTSFDVSFGNLA